LFVMSVCVSCLSVLSVCNVGVSWPNGWMDQEFKMKLGTEVGLGPGHIVSVGDPAPPPQKGAQQPPLFGPCLLWSKWQRAQWIKMPLGMEVGLSPGHILLDGDPAASKKRGTAPHVWPMYIVAKWLDGARCHLIRR